ncbi:MAG: formate dehydrogenase accessory sulfurtransferase FdhD [Rhodomicrobiaceae bacterium]
MSKRIYEPNNYLVPPPDLEQGLCKAVSGVDQDGVTAELFVINEKPLTLYLNSREVVTMMTIGDHPRLLALGFLANQAMLDSTNPVTAVEYDEDLDVVVVRTEHETNFEEKMKKRVRTSGCAQGTVFEDVMGAFGRQSLADIAAPLKTSWLYSLTSKINMTPSLYLEAGAIHGTVLCKGDQPLVYMEDVGRHNAVDKVSGWMVDTGTDGADKILYTTGRLTSEMVIKTVMMGIPVLVSRSGFTAAGVELAQQAGLTLIGRARGRRFMALSGAERIVFDSDPNAVDEEEPRHRRKGADA